jgi:hypothetical protein
MNTQFNTGAVIELPQTLNVRVDMKRLLALVVFMTVAATAHPQLRAINGPDCSGGWPTDMTFVHLKNAGLVDNNSIDFSKTKTSRLASEKVGKGLWRQVYDVTFTKKSGDRIEAIAVHDASLEECSMSGVEVFVVSSHLNPERK